MKLGVYRLFGVLLLNRKFAPLRCIFDRFFGEMKFQVAVFKALWFQELGVWGLEVYCSWHNFVIKVGRKNDGQK